MLDFFLIQKKKKKAKNRLKAIYEDKRMKRHSRKKTDDE